MKIPSFVIEGVFIASRRHLHRPTKASSQNCGIEAGSAVKKANRIGRIEELYSHKTTCFPFKGKSFDEKSKMGSGR